MTNQVRISFLIPAHNEERVIGHALQGLKGIVGPEIEVLVGLDGCTDGTKEVVQHYHFAKIVDMEERGGKPAVLNRLIALAKADIVAVHDADWRFVCDRKGLAALIESFDDPQLGGIVLPPHNIPFLEMRRGIKSRVFRGSGLGVWLVHQFLLQTQTKWVGQQLYVDNQKVTYPFTIDIFRKGAIPDSTTRADDLERFMSLGAAGYLLKVFTSKELPYYQITDQTLTLRDQFRQRTGAHLARAQLQSKLNLQMGLLRFHLPFLAFCLRNVTRLGLGDSLLVGVWYATIASAWLRARFLLRKGVPDAKEAWRYRVTRTG